MSDLPVDLDLKFLPDWLKEGGSANRYADYQGERADRPRRDDRGHDDRGARGPRQDRSDRRGSKGPKRDGARPSARAPRPGEGPRRQGAPTAGADRGARDAARPAPAPVDPGVKIEFLPEPTALTMIARQIKASARAYPLFGTARLFLERPERHRVRFTAPDANHPLFQLEDGPIAFDRATVERNAFHQLRDDFYREDVTVGEPLKGNFSNVARCRSTGVLLGPTNYHAYQPALRKLYEERFSRRMSFPQFQAEEIECVTDEQTISTWKEQARSSTTFATVKEAEPLTFKTMAEAEQHFRRTHLPSLIKSGTVLESSGQASRAVGDRGLANALRATWEKERAFPASLVNHVRAHLLDAGLHFFKHRKRIVFVSPIRPQRHQSGHVFSEGIAAILRTIEETPRMTRPQLAAKLLGEATHPDAPAKKAALAADLHYLIHAGHVIEFHDSTLDLPLTPRAEKEAAAGELEAGTQPTPAERREVPLVDSPRPEGGTPASAPTDVAASGADAALSPAASVEPDAPGPAPEQNAAMTEESEPVPYESTGAADPRETSS